MIDDYKKSINMVNVTLKDKEIYYQIKKATCEKFVNKYCGGWDDTWQKQYNDRIFEESLAQDKYSFKDYLFNKKYRNRIKLLKNFSKHIDVYAIGSEAYIFDNGINMQIFGKYYKFTNGKIEKFKN